MKVYDKIRITSSDYEFEKVYPGMIGYILEKYSDGRYELEFSDKITGETIALLVFKDSDMAKAE